MSKEAESNGDTAVNRSLNLTPEEEAGENISLASYTVANLKEMARQKNIKGFSSMNKQQLIEALGGEPLGDDHTNT